MNMSKKENKTPLTKEEKRKEFWRTIKYILFAASAGLIEFGSFSLLTLIPYLSLKENYWIPATISLTLSVIWNFTFNRKFTFQSANNVPIAMLKVLAYYLVFAPLSIWLAQMYLVDQLGWNEFLVKAVVMLVNFITEFLYQRFFVFGKTIDTNDIAQKQKQKELENKEKTPE